MLKQDYIKVLKERDAWREYAFAWENYSTPPHDFYARERLVRAALALTELGRSLEQDELQ